ncbi:MAG TPA: alpha-L-fucosidase, partial [Aquabacterium sp.]|uniref:alpha-L-fucosidase n=1 Tax=Aquabacterium sp. TaxID=1872578 RepID=UPI002E34A0D5
DQNLRALVRAHYFDLIDRYQPDLLWNDLAFIGNPYEVQAYYFNRRPDGVVNDRWKSPVRFYDSAFEKQGPNLVYEGLMAGLQSAINVASLNEPVTPSVSKVFSDFDTHEYIDFPQAAYPNTRYFEGTRGVGRSFAYTANDTAFSSGDALIHLLVDVVSKNGNLLLNIGPRPDGSVPDQQALPLRELGRWLSVHGPAIYGTRPWRHDRALSREGDKLQFTTDQQGHLYVFVDQAWAKDRTLTLPDVLVDTSVPASQAVTVLGRSSAPLWSQQGGDLQLTLPYQATNGTSSSLVAIKVRLHRSVWAAYLASSGSYWR